MVKEYKQPTYEQYVNASKLDRFRYKYGIFVLILCWLALISLSYFVYSYGEEISRHPFIYGADKAGVSCNCHCKDIENRDLSFFVNGSDLKNNNLDTFSNKNNLLLNNLTLLPS